MARRKRSYSRSYARRVKMAKYSNETFCIAQAVTNNTGNPINGYFQVIPESSTLGMRKVKNFTVNMSYKATERDQFQRSLFWALVYVPQGTEPSPINVGSNDTLASIYEPNQNVIMSSITVLNENSRTWKTRLARNLNSGDKIMLVYAGDDTGGTFNDVIQLTVNFAISY